MTLDVLLIGLFFILLQLFANHLIRGRRDKSFRWLSFSGGVAVAYVFA